MMALVAAGTWNSSATYLSTAVKGACSGTFTLQVQQNKQSYFCCNDQGAKVSIEHSLDMTGKQFPAFKSPSSV